MNNDSVTPTTPNPPAPELTPIAAATDVTPPNSPTVTATIPTNPESHQPQVPLIQPTTPVMPAATLQQPNPKRRLPKWLLFALIGLVVLAVGGGGAFAYLKSQNKPAAKPATTASKTSTAKPKVSAKVISGYALLAKPEKIGDLNFIANTSAEFGDNCEDFTNHTGCKPYINASDISYFKIGTTPANKAVVVAAIQDQGELNRTFVATETETGKYTILAAMSGMDPSLSYSSDSVKTLQKDVSPNISVDATTVIKDYQFPETFTVKDATLSLQLQYNPMRLGNFMRTLSDLRGDAFAKSDINSTNLKTLATSNGVTYYALTAKDSDNYQIKELYGSRNDIFGISYILKTSLQDEKPKITWASGSKEVKAYTSRPVGCGSFNGYLIAKNIDEAQLQQVGSGPAGEKLYQLPDSNPLLNEIFKDDYAAGTNQEVATNRNLTLAQFQDAHGVFVTKNAFGEYAAYLRTDLINVGGCGKPVVYLYPQKTMSVAVKVGAQITKSAPLYEANGWQNVIAQPNGQLTYHGKPYPNLFWEGQGFGLYPRVDFGTVVPQAKVVSTIKQQLAAQGFNSNETRDFLDFWQPKLPHTAYVRLSWLNTKQMDELAPLQIAPRPNTMIRTFLDFQGQDTPNTTLQPQTFSAPARTGFTVTEWGGLLHDNNK